MSEGRASKKKPLVLRVAIQFKTLLKLGVILFTLMLVATFFGVKTTEKPKFCSTCKIMVPYYQAWKTSTHNHVPCIECHYAPGIRSTFEGKFKALSQVAKYVTSTAGTRPWAEIPDESCLREGCHDRRLLQGMSKFGNVVFDHRPHLLEMRRGKQLRCTSCHSQVVMGNHLSVTPSTCFICHFKGKTFTEIWNSCTVCHKNPPKVVKIKGQKFRHSDFIERNVPCMKCHNEVLDGNGEVPRERCQSCHSEPKHTAQYDNHALIHKKHVTEHKVECFDCHLEIEHRMPKENENKMPDCQICHIDTHKAQFDMYYGVGGKRTSPYTSEMARRQVDCRACHIVNPGDPDAMLKGTTLVTKSVACMACHGPEYKDIMDNWKRAMGVMISQTEQIKAQAEAARPSWELDKKDRKLADQLFNDAKYNLKFVKLAKGEHNIHYARELIYTSRDIFTELINPVPERLQRLVEAKKKEAPPTPDRRCTNLCHVIEPDTEITFGNKKFPHVKHGPSRDIPCTRCHSDKTHGKTLIQTTDCNKCHHIERGATDCLGCHQDTIPSSIGRFPHRRHFTTAKLSCSNCHHKSSETGAISTKADCATCHHRSKQSANCSRCHRGALPTRRGASFPHQRHAASFGFACKTCHSLSSRSSKMVFTRDCKTCHHSASVKKACAQCHTRQWQDTKSSPMSYPCDFCHGAAGGSLSQARAKCRSCHAGVYEQAGHGGASGNSVPACTKCHRPHKWIARR